jgi:hypothetical protein
MNKLCTSTICLLIIFTIGIIACSSNIENSTKNLEEKQVNDVSVLIDAETNNAIAHPVWIKSVSDGFFLFDAKTNEVAKFNLKGQKLLSVGSQGRGPGEFQSVGGFWKFNDRILVYDITGKKLIQYDDSGSHVKDIMLDFVTFSGMPTGMEVISAHQFFMPSNGKNGSLLRLVDLNTKSVEYFGEAVDKDGNAGKVQSSAERQQAITSGEIPAMYKNNVLLSSNNTGLYSFQQTTARLEKYDFSGKLLWTKNLKVPAVDDLFERLFDENRSRIKNSKMLLPFVYADGISASKKGVAVKLNLFANQPLTVVWVPNHGKRVTVVTFPELKNLSPVPHRFAISDDHQKIFFVSTLEGKVYEASWLF